MIRWLSICLALICADVVVAEATRLVARGEMSREPTMRPQQRPYERPDLIHGANTLPLYLAEQNLFAFSPTAIASSLRPGRRPASIEQAAQAVRVARLRGQICGDPNIQDEAVGRISGRGACGVENAVRIKSVAGVRMSPQSTVDCRTATALKRWVVNGAKPAVASEGGGIALMRVVSHYSCRNRNSTSLGRLSEHAFGHAIDIAGIKLNSGREITVLGGWNTRDGGARLRKMWRAACEPFGTVLGPDAN